MYRKKYGWIYDGDMKLGFSGVLVIVEVGFGWDDLERKILNGKTIKDINLGNINI